MAGYWVINDCLTLLFCWNLLDVTDPYAGSTTVTTTATTTATTTTTNGTNKTEAIVRPSS
uniref:Uncharacterized protein n=1 Tax=Rhodnius prolixus TaxID=13249 RepID=T1HSB7_RHOPR